MDFKSCIQYSTLRNIIAQPVYYLLCFFKKTLKRCKCKKSKFIFSTNCNISQIKELCTLLVEGRTDTKNLPSI